MARGEGHEPSGSGGPGVSCFKRRELPWPESDPFAIVYEAKTRTLYGLNASGWAPKALTADYLLGKGDKTMPQKGINSVTVPGTVDGWDKLLKKFGRKTFGDVLAPAITYAEHG